MTKNTDKDLPGMLVKDPENLTDHDLDELFDGADEWGFYVTKSDLPTLESYKKDGNPAWFEELVSAGRLVELEKGAEPTAEEIFALREYVREGMKSGEWDAEVIPAYGVTPFRTPSGRKLYAVTMRKGYSFSGVTTWLHGIYKSQGAAVEELEKRND
jgi:hypothetical protein